MPNLTGKIDLDEWGFGTDELARVLVNAIRKDLADGIRNSLDDFPVHFTPVVAEDGSVRIEILWELFGPLEASESLSEMIDKELDADRGADGRVGVAEPRAYFLRMAEALRREADRIEAALDATTR